MKKRKSKKNQKISTSPKRTKEIMETFNTLGLTKFSAFTDNLSTGDFKKVSIYDSENYFYSTSSNSKG